MAVTDITFLIFMGVGILAFTPMSFIWRGIIWLPWISGIFWLLLGIWCRVTPDVTFMFQREIGVLFIGIFLAMMFAPFYMKAKDADVIEDAPDDIDIWGKQHQAHRDKIDKRKKIRGRSRED